MKKEFRLLQCFGEIRDEFLEEAVSEKPMEKRRKFSKWLQYGTVGLCAAMMLCAGLAVYSKLGARTDGVQSLPGTTQIGTVEDSVQIPNPFQECDSLESAEALAGFSFTVPDSFANYRNRIIQAQDAYMIEVFYRNADDTEGLRIRKAIGTDEISGDYNAYTLDKTEAISGREVHVRGNGEMLYAADWTDGTYAYSITTDVGISMETLESLLAEIA